MALSMDTITDLIHSIMGKPTLSNHNTEIDSLSAWYQQPLGCELAYLEVEQLQPIFHNLSGESLLQLGESELLSSIETKRVFRRFTVQPMLSSHSSQLTAQSTYTELPFSDKSIDVVFLPHTLESVADGTNVLNEVWRILAPDGHLIIVGFNPWSFWGLWRTFGQKNIAPWNKHSHGAQKWRQQIHQLNGTITLAKYLFFRPPLNNQTFLTQSRWLDKTLQLLFPAAGGVFILVAQKRTVPLTPLKSKFSWTELLAGQKTLEPTTRGVRRG